jgi:tripartite-type tricarboxylate transporter receptor subunit TctC
MRSAVLRAIFGIVGVAALVVAGAGQTQTFPSKPISLTFGLPAGGAVDMVARLYAEQVSATLGQRVIVEAKPGASGIVAAGLLTQQAPDGHSIMVALGGMHTIAPALQALPFDPIKDFTPITLLFSFPTLLAVPASSPVKSVSDLVALSKTKAGGLNFGSQGLGSPQHLIGVLLQEKSGAAMTTVHYRGATPIMTDLAAGRVDFAFSSLAVFRPLMEDGKIRIIAVAENARWPRMPEIPTIAESGYPGVELDTWFGLVAPRGTPAPVVQKLHDAFAAASRDATLNKRLTDEGLVVRRSSPGELAALMLADYERLGALIRARGIKIEQ